MNEKKAKLIILLLTELEDNKEYYTNIDKVINLLPTDSIFKGKLIKQRNHMKKWGSKTGKERRVRRSDMKDDGVGKLLVYCHRFIQ